VLQALKKQDPQRFAFLNHDDEFNAFYRYKVALYEEMLAENPSLASSLNGNGADLSHMQQQAVARFPTLKGFFR
jgi:hypothetical protein